jgi:hypothetical protein
MDIEKSGSFLRMNASADNDHWEIAQQALQTRPNISLKNSLGADLFLEALGRAPNDFIQFCLDRGVEVNRRIHLKEAVLHYLLRLEKREVQDTVSMLIKHGADARLAA